MLNKASLSNIRHTMPGHLHLALLPSRDWHACIPPCLALTRHGENDLLLRLLRGHSPESALTEGHLASQLGNLNVLCLEDTALVLCFAYPARAHSGTFAPIRNFYLCVEADWKVYLYWCPIVQFVQVKYSCFKPQ